MPPNINGHGGSQRAWYLLNALLPLGDIHFVLLFRKMDRDCMETPLTHLEPLVKSITRINIAGWQPADRKGYGIVPAAVLTIMKMRSQEAPKLSADELRKVAAAFPDRTFDLIFACRLCVATIVQQLIDKKFLTSSRCVVDFDDIMSKFIIRDMLNAGENISLLKRLRMRLDSKIVSRAENRIASGWAGVSVCTDHDVAQLRRAHPTRRVVKIPNVVSRVRLPPRQSDGRFLILFTGNLGFAPNIDGLRVFLEQAWPLVLKSSPSAALKVVGMNPSPMVEDLVSRFKLELRANVPTLEPYYQNCDVVIAPILFGSGTRIKILEAMAYGRAVVSTSIGAEGLSLTHGHNVLLADKMIDFADALVTLQRSPALLNQLASNAHSFQQANYSPSNINSSLLELTN